MTWLYERFIDLDIPLLSGVQDIGTGESPRKLFPLSSGGVYDSLGDEQAPRGSTAITIRGWIVERDAATFAAKLKAWRAKRGKRGKLYRRWDTSGEVQWAMADLRNEPIERGVANWNNQEIVLNFVIQSPIWYGAHHGAGWSLDDGIYLDEGYVLDEDDTFDLTPDGITLIPLTFGGDATVTNVTLLISNPQIGIGPGGLDITALSIKIGPDASHFESSWTYDGVIAPTDEAAILGISVGARRVELDGVGDYDHFHIVDAEQLIDTWARLQPTGSAVIRVEMTGGPTSPAATLTASFWEGDE